MRLAVFTNEFPSRLNTFFSRDMRALLDAGFDMDIFPFYPLNPALWQCVPDILSERFFQRTKVHHITLFKSLASVKPWPLRKVGRFVRDTVAISASASRFGIMPLAKSAYIFPKAWAWALQSLTNYDHILAYWGNYAATCAYLFHRLTDRRVPFSMFLHAGMDLYTDQVYLRQKLLYADNIIVVCDFNRQFIRKRYSDIFHLISKKIYLYHLGLDFAEFPYESNGRLAHTVLAVGSLEKYKGFDFLLRATQELMRRGIQLKVELVGDGAESGSLKALADNLKIHEMVRFHGLLPFDQVRTLMRQATILVHPSSTLSGDAVPTVIKEAMALGTPVIASELAGIPELLDNGRCGILVPPRDVKALAHTIQTMLTNNPLRRNYANAARRYAEEKFDLWRNARRLADLLGSTKREKT